MVHRHPLSHVWSGRQGRVPPSALRVARTPLFVLVVLLPLAFFAVCGGSATAQTKDAFDAFDEGNALLGEGDAEGAESQFRMALRMSPEFIAARNNLGIALYKQGRFDEALSEFEQVAASSGRHRAGGRLNVGAATASKGNLDDALDRSEAAVKLRADYAEAYFNIGWIQDARGKLAEAEAAYRNAIRQKPAYVKAELGLAIVLAERQQFDDALELISAVLRRDGLTPEDQALAEKNLFAARVFAELGNPSPRDQAEVTARGSPA